MSDQIKFRIYTEDVDERREETRVIISNHLESCTLFYGVGLWKSLLENSLVIEFIGEAGKWEGTVASLALALKRELNQQAVMVTQELVKVTMA